MQFKKLFVVLLLIVSSVSIFADQFDLNPDTPAMYPYDGPQEFANSYEREVYSWSYSGIDRNGCRRCVDYSPRLRCTPEMVGERIRSPRPGTVNDDYTYTCEAGFANRLPADGPQRFANSEVGSDYVWRFQQIDRNGCNRCRPYNPRFRCNSRNVGERMKSPRPNTNNDDYVYICEEE